MKLDTLSPDFHWYSPNKSVLWIASKPLCKQCAKYPMVASQFTFGQKTLPNQEKPSIRPALLSSWNLKQNHNRAQSKWNLGQPFALCMKYTKVLKANFQGVKYHRSADFWTNSSIKCDLHYRLCPDLWSITTAVLPLDNSKLWLK